MTAQVPVVEATPTTSMIKTLGIVATVCGLIIVGAYQGTYSAVAANKKIAIERAVFKVIPGSKNISEFYAMPNGIAPAAGETPPGAVKFYAAYDANDRLTGVAAEAGAKGYADVVRILYGYSQDCRCIIGIGVVSMRETPGIGDKILTDRQFLANFTALDVKLNADLSALANAVKTVKHGTKSHAWEVEAISGATVTSKAVGKGINDSAQLLLPKLVPQIEKLRSRQS
jgi:Na+-translocating ferredoxin:NAD+ oxidoreductase subunit G